MGELQKVIEAEALFMDALGGEFQPITDSEGRTHTLARLARNMATEQAKRPVEHGGKGSEEISKELTWAPATAYLSSVPFEMRSFGFYGERGQALIVPVCLSINITRKVFGIRNFKVELFHPELFKYDFQPHGPETGRIKGDGYLSLTAFSYANGGGGHNEYSEKIGLNDVSHGYEARRLVTVLAEKAFCEEF